MEILPQKRPSPEDLGPVQNGEGHIEEGHVGKKGRFEKATAGKQKSPPHSLGDEDPDGDNVHDEESPEEEEGYSDEDEIEGGHGDVGTSQEEDVEEESRVDTVVSTDPFDLPDEVLPQIFKTGISIVLAARVSKKWRAKLESLFPAFWKYGNATGTSLLLAEEEESDEVRAMINSTPELWKNACAKISVYEGGITQQWQKRLKVKSKKSKWHDKALVWKEIYLQYSSRVCRYCFNHEGTEYPLFGDIVLCFPCKKLEPYNALTTTQARKYFKIHTKKVKEKMTEQGISLDTYSYENRRGYEITLYKFTELVEMARKVKGEEVADEMVEKYRSETGTGKMEGDLREV